MTGGPAEPQGADGLTALWRRLLVPRRTIRPTRDGWWCVLAAVSLGVAAVNTGNNLAYLLCSLLLALITVSGILSDVSMRGVHVASVLPEEFFAGRPAVLGATVRNRRRWFTSYSITLEVRGAAGAASLPGPTLYVPRLDPGGERLCSWEAVLPARGRHRLSGARITTRFPFGLFVKRTPTVLQSEVLVYPTLAPLSAERLRELGASGELPARRRGRGQDVYSLREYRPGDDPRLIHWPSTAKAGALTVREPEEETAQDTRLVLVGEGAAGPLLERGLSEAASLARHLARAGVGVELAGPGVLVPLARGLGQERAILTALALYTPGEGSGRTGPRAGATPGTLREILIHVG